MAKRWNQGLRDIAVVKIDNTGKTQWIKQFGAGEPLTSGAYATTPCNGY